MKYLKIASILTLIAVICAAIIASFNLLTSSTIQKNKEETELKTYQLIYDDYSYNKDITSKLDSSTTDFSVIEKAVNCYDANDSFLGCVYSVSGKNAYGSISLMVAVKDSLVTQVEFVENTESFASTVEKHVKSKYPSSASDVIYIGFNESVSDKVSSLSYNDVLSIDTKCSATYGAKLVQKLVIAALSAKEVA